MFSIDLTPTQLGITLTGLHRLATLRGSVVVDRSNVRAVRVVEDPWSEITGMRIGTGWPRVVAMGRWFHDDVKDFVYVTRGQQAVVVELAGEEYSRLILGSDDADALAAHLTLD